MPGLNSQSRGHGRHLFRIIVLLCCDCHCVVLLSLCCSVVIMLYCYCVALLLFVLSYVLIVCTVPLPPGVNPIAFDKYILSYHIIKHSIILAETMFAVVEHPMKFLLEIITVVSSVNNMGSAREFIPNVRSFIQCPKRNGQNFGRVFLVLNYTDITQNTYIQS